MSKNTFEKLKSLVNEAEMLLSKEGEFFTEGSKVSILDLVNHAKSVLNGTYKVPFIRNREFYKPREDEDIQFAMERYTMTPSYHMRKYGLRPALEWFKRQHVMNEEKQSLIEKKDFVILKAKELLKNSKTDGSIGSFRLTEVKELENAVASLEGLQGEMLGETIVKVYDAMRKVRHSRILRTDVEENSTLYFSQKDLNKFKNKVLNDSILNEELNTLKKIADKYTMEEIKSSKIFLNEKINYEEGNKYFYVWSTTDKVINFTTPKNANFARLKFILPSFENEQEGLGHVWIDNIQVYPSKGSDWDIKNTGFEDGLETPEYWSPIVLMGKPKFKWEDKKPFCGLEKRSIYIENPTSSDEGGFEYIEDIPVEEGISNTITFNAKLDGKLKEGLKILIEFKDKQGKKIDEFVAFFNRKSSLVTKDFSLNMQADAIMYLFTEDITYAEKAKQEMLFVLNDFCQGIEYWLVNDARPAGNDAYGAVQGGRVLCSLMSTYTLIKASGVFSREDKEVMMCYLEYFVRYLFDLRDRTELTEYDAQADASNWHTDMAAGTGMLMMAMPEFPNARQWLENANMVLRSQLKLNVNSDGSWPESLRYHFAALGRFLIYSKALINCTGENWITDGPVASMFKYAIMMQTPKYEYFDNKIATLNFGDHVIDGGSGFLLAGIYCDDIAKLDEELGNMMYESWINAGKPKGQYSGEAVAMENLFMVGNSYSSAEGYKLNLKSCGDFKEAGIYTFRKNFGKSNESLFAIMSSPRKIGHGHYDEGSFIIYKNSKLIVPDLGIEGYFDSSKNWFVSSSAHNVVQFSRREGKLKPKVFGGPQDITAIDSTSYSDEEGWLDTPRQCETLDFYTSEALDSITIKILNPEGQGYHVRKVDFYRDAEIYVIHDKVYDFSRNVRFNLNVAATESIIEDNRVLSKGHYDVDIEIVFLGEKPEISLEWGRTKPMYPAVNGKNLVSNIYAVGSGKEGFLTVIYPKAADLGNLNISKKDDKYIIVTPESKRVEI